MKLVAMLSEEVPFGVSINALAHASLGLAAKALSQSKLKSTNKKYLNNPASFSLAEFTVEHKVCSSSEILEERKQYPSKNRFLSTSLKQ